ncbi:MAG: hypothetical protein D6800_14450, partial [Candidatus Zixiibacteriota bacterium]
MLRALRQTTLIVVLYVGLVPHRATAGQVDFRAGFGYEFISQEFFLDTALTVDSLDVITSQNTTYLDDFKGGFGLIYRPFDDRRLELEPSYEQTPDYIRLKFSGRSNLHPGDNRLNISWDFERRDRYRNIEEAGDSYISGSSQFRLLTPLSDAVKLSTRLEASAVSFDSTDDFSLNQFRGGGRVGLQFKLPGFSSLDIGGFFFGRAVPDSNLLNYISFGTELAYFGLLGANDLDIRGQVERRDYNTFDNEDDYTRLELESRFNWHPGGILLVRNNLESETVLFSAAQVLNFNYTRLAADLLFGFDHQGVTLVGGPH